MAYSDGSGLFSYALGYLIFAVSSCNATLNRQTRQQQKNNKTTNCHEKEHFKTHSQN